MDGLTLGAVADLYKAGADVLILNGFPAPAETALSDGDELFLIRRGEVPWEDVEKWRLSLHQEFNAAFETTKLPERPDYERANAFLISARHRALSEDLP